MSFDYKEFIELRNKFIKMDKEFDMFLRNFLLEMGLRALADTKRNTPVDTGLLKNSWQIGDSNYTIQTRVNKSNKLKVSLDKRNVAFKDVTVKGVTRKGDTLEVILYNPAEYASFREYGHMTRNRDGWVEGQFMCTIAINRIESQIPARFETAFNTWIRSLGM